jgi:hypothetical protein
MSYQVKRDKESVDEDKSPRAPRNKYITYFSIESCLPNS